MEQLKQCDTTSTVISGVPGEGQQGPLPQVPDSLRECQISNIKQTNCWQEVMVVVVLILEHQSRDTLGVLHLQVLEDGYWRGCKGGQ